MLPLFCSPGGFMHWWALSLWLPVCCNQWETLAGGGRAAGEWNMGAYSPAPTPWVACGWWGSAATKGHSSSASWERSPLRPSQQCLPAIAWPSWYPAYTFVSRLCLSLSSVPLWEWTIFFCQDHSFWPPFPKSPLLPPAHKWLPFPLYVSLLLSHAFSPSPWFRQLSIISNFYHSRKLSQKACQNKRAFKKSCCLMGFYSKMKKIGPEKINVLPEVHGILPRGSSTVLPFARYIDWG